MATVQWIFPLLDEISAVISATLQVLAGRLSLKIVNLNKDIAKIKRETEKDSDKDDKEVTYAIGFHASANSDELEEDDEDDE